MVPGSIGVLAVSAGESHNCAVMSGGGAKCWGKNTSGQLGDGTSVDRWTPVDVTGLGSSVTSIAPAQYHTCASAASGAATALERKHGRHLVTIL